MNNNQNDAKALKREKKQTRKKRFRPDNRRSVFLIQELLARQPKKLKQK